MDYVLVTGAYGGMGKATVKKLTELGFTVFAMDKVTDSPCENVIPLSADVTDEQSILSAFETVKKTTNNLFAIIHFAGIYRLDSLVEIQTSDLKKVFDVNLFGATAVNRTFCPLLNEGGRIIMITSELAPLSPLPFTGIYAISKSALDKYAFSLKMELQLKGVFVSVLRAGAIDTGMLSVSTNELEKFCEKTQTYKLQAQRFKTIVDGVEAKKIPPQKLADKVIKILGKKKPSFAYAINRNPLLRLFEILPTRLRFFVIKKIIGKKP